MVNCKLTWTKRATQQLKSAIKHIRKDSEKNADKIRDRLLHKISQLLTGKIVHRKDPHKKNNDGTFFYFEEAKYRIVYRLLTDEIIIVRIRHTKMEPLKY